MSIYPLLVLLHMLGAVGMFAAWGAEALALAQLRHAADAGEARTRIADLARPGPLGPASMGAALVTGLLMAGRWGYPAWMVAAIVGMIAIAAIGLSFARRSARSLGASPAGEAGRRPADLQAAAEVLRRSLRLRVSIAVGILGLMAVKPALFGTLVIASVAVVAGFGATVLPTRRRRAAAA